MSASEHGDILIAGVGNLLRSDDGIGVHVVRLLQKQNLPGVRTVEVGTAVLHGLSFVEQSRRVLVIDAARGGNRPGTIYQWDEDASAAFERPLSLHAAGLCQALRLLLPERVLPPITVLGVEPECLDFGLALSPALQAVLPRVAALAKERVAAWLREGADIRDGQAEERCVCRSS
jgi:hydrogenase maturation protease